MEKINLVEFMQKFKEKTKPQTELVRKAVSELNGKTMDYESCSLIEQIVLTHSEKMFVEFVNALKVLVDENRLRNPRLGDIEKDHLKLCGFLYLNRNNIPMELRTQLGNMVYKHYKQ